MSSGLLNGSGWKVASPRRRVGITRSAVAWGWFRGPGFLDGPIRPPVPPAATGPTSCCSPPGCYILRSPRSPARWPGSRQPPFPGRARGRPALGLRSVHQRGAGPGQRPGGNPPRRPSDGPGAGRAGASGPGRQPRSSRSPIPARPRPGYGVPMDPADRGGEGRGVRVQQPGHQQQDPGLVAAGGMGIRMEEPPAAGIEERTDGPRPSRSPPRPAPELGAGIRTGGERGCACHHRPPVGADPPGRPSGEAHPGRRRTGGMRGASRHRRNLSPGRSKRQANVSPAEQTSDPSQANVPSAGPTSVAAVRWAQVEARRARSESIGPAAARPEGGRPGGGIAGRCCVPKAAWPPRSEREGGTDRERG
jgi:hypothetical protein